MLSRRHELKKPLRVVFISNGVQEEGLDQACALPIPAYSVTAPLAPPISRCLTHLLHLPLERVLPHSQRARAVSLLLQVFCSVITACCSHGVGCLLVINP